MMWLSATSGPPPRGAARQGGVTSFHGMGLNFTGQSKSIGGYLEYARSDSRLYFQAPCRA